MLFATPALLNNATNILGHLEISKLLFLTLDRMNVCLSCGNEYVSVKKRVSYENLPPPFFFFSSCTLSFFNQHGPLNKISLSFALCKQGVTS